MEFYCCPVTDTVYVPVSFLATWMVISRIDRSILILLRKKKKEEGGAKKRCNLIAFDFFFF